MNTQTQATATVPVPTTPTVPANPAKESVVIPDAITSYEDGVKAVEAAISSADVALKDDVLRKVQKLFTTRIAKRSSDAEKDGVATVKRSLEANKRFYGQLRAPNPLPGTAS